MRLIDADVLIDHLLEVMETAKHFGNTEVSDTLCGVIGVIKGEKTITIPTAELDTTNDFAEWIDVNGDGSIMKCSKCGEEVCCKNNNFCPNCGADMRKMAKSESEEIKEAVDFVYDMFKRGEAE